MVAMTKFGARKLKASAQMQLRWATVPEQSGSKSGGCCAPFRGGSWVSI